MNRDERFALLRSYLSHPSSESWEQLLSLFTEWAHDDQRMMALQYAEGHLQHWPHLLRTISRKHWDLWSVQTDDWPLFRLVQSLDL